MDKDALIIQLYEIDKISNEQWLQGLEDRKLKELEFHNQNRDAERMSAMEKSDQDSYEKYYSNRKFYSTTQWSKNYYEQWIRTNAPGKIFLDYACGNGGNALIAAEAGAALSVGIDISDVSVRNCRDRAKERNLNNTFFLQADAENTQFPDNSVDVIICSGMLHHLDLNYAFPELKRILSPGGKIMCVEALDYNPFIRMYRKRTPEMRTEWEKSHILSMKDVRFARKYFLIGKIKFWHITSYLGVYARWIQPLLNGIDWILTRIPGIQRMAWIFTFELLSDKKGKTE